MLGMSSSLRGFFINRVRRRKRSSLSPFAFFSSFCVFCSCICARRDTSFCFSLFSEGASLEVPHISFPSRVSSSRDIGYYGIGQASQRVRTCFLSFARVFLSSWFLRTCMMISATCVAASCFMPRVVMAGVPRRIPDGSIGFLGSQGIIFLLHDIPASSRAYSASFPVIPSEPNTSRRIIWFSVPQDTTLMPFSMNLSDMAIELSTIWRAQTLKLGSSASLKAIAFAKVV